MIDDIVLTYTEAWNEPDDAARRKLLKRCLTEDSVLTDPMVNADGREAIAAHIAGFAQRWPGHRIALTSGIEGRSGRVRYTWALLKLDGSVLAQGTDFGELAPDGRLHRITGFFGSPPVIPDTWPDRLVYRTQS